MDKNYLYYNNRNKEVLLSCVYPDYRKDMFKYLLKENYLSDYNSEEDLYRVLYNLGILDRLELLKNLIDSKVILAGGISWDTEPTKGHTEQILSSDAVWRVLLNFKSNEYIDNLIQTLWNNILSRIDKIDLDIKEDLQNFIPTFVKNEINKYILDLLNQIDSLDIHGIAVSNEFGTDTHISVSLKTITDAINKLWQKFEDITGEILQGINMVVTPEYFISEDGTDVHITANTVDTTGIFEHIALYSNGALIAEASNVDYFEHDLHIDETTVIMCKAKILGVEYTRQSVITHYNSFWLGAGSTYSDIMDVEHVIPITNGMRGAYNVHVEEGQRIIIVVDSSLAEGFIRADLNSVEIPFTESTVTVDNKSYKVFTSDPWAAGDYNIDVNG